MLHPARLSICLSVRPSALCLQLSKNRKAMETYITLDKSNRGAKLRSKGQKSRSLTTGNESLKIVFAHIVVKSGSIHVKPRPK